MIDNATGNVIKTVQSFIIRGIIANSTAYSIVGFTYCGKHLAMKQKSWNWKPQILLPKICFMSNEQVFTKFTSLVLINNNKMSISTYLKLNV